MTFHAEVKSLPTASGLGAMSTIFDVQRTETTRRRFGPGATTSRAIGRATLLSVRPFPRPVTQSGTASTSYQGHVQKIGCGLHTAQPQPFSVLMSPHGSGRRLQLIGLLPGTPSITCFQTGREPFVGVPLPGPSNGYVVNLSAARLRRARIVIGVDEKVSGRASDLFHTGQQDADVSVSWRGTVTLAHGQGG